MLVHLVFGWVWLALGLITLIFGEDTAFWACMIIANVYFTTSAGSV